MVFCGTSTVFGIKKPSRFKSLLYLLFTLILSKSLNPSGLVPLSVKGRANLTKSGVGFYVGLRGDAHIQGWAEVHSQNVRISRKKGVLWIPCEWMRAKNWGGQNSKNSLVG